MFDVDPPAVQAEAFSRAPEPAPEDAASEPPDEVLEQGASPVYYRLPPGTFRVPFRIVLGAAYRPPWTTAEPKAAFALAIDAGFPTNIFSSDWRSTERASPWALMIHLGYAYGSFSEHLGLLGVGPHVRVFTPTSEPLGAIGEGPFHASLTPHLALGSREGNFAVGVRTSLTLGFWIFGIELSHQLTHTSASDAHAFYLLAGFLASMEGGDR